MKSIRFPLASLLFAAVASVSVAWADTLDTSLFAKKINFTVSGYSGESTLANFPVLVRLSNVSGFNFADFPTPADELRFTDAAGNNLNYEIDTWDSSAGKALVWVSVPSLSGTTTEIRAYYLPDSTNDLPAVSSTAVWTSAGYVGVWHMNSPSTADASNSGNDGTAFGAVAVTDGVVGSGLAYPNTNSYVSCGSNLPEATLIDGYTIEGWVNLASTKGKKALFGKSGFISYRMEDASVKITTPKVKDYSNVNNFITAANEWHHFALSFATNTTNGAKHYADGVNKASQDTTGINNITGSIEMWLGRNQWEGAEAFLGRLDEYRLSASIRSADWIAADYATQNNPTFLTAGPVIACRTMVGLSLTQNGGTCALFSSLVDGITLQEGASATLRIRYGTAADALIETVAAANPVVAAGAVPITVKGLSHGTTYYFKAVLEMPGGQNVESEVLAVTTLADYTPAMRRIEYIESTGTQYIDSRYYPTPNTHVKADYQYVAFQYQNRVFGLSVGLYFHAYINGNGKFAYNWSNTTNWKELSAKGNTNRNLYDFNYIDNGGNHAYTIYGPDGGVTVTKSPMEGSATKTAAATLAIAAQRTDALGGVSAGEIAKNHRIYSMTFDEGGDLTAALAPAVRAADGTVGLYDGVRDLFLPSASSDSYIPGPTITTVERYTGTALTAIDLTFLGAPMARSLCIAYGPGYCGDNPAYWGVTQFVAAVAAGATSYTVTSIPASWGSEDACVLRCYFDDGTPFPLWSDMVVYRDAMAEPVVSGVTVDGSGGDTLVVRGNLSYLPGDDCALSVRVCTPSGTNIWSGLEGSVRTATGDFELTLNEGDTSSPRYITPGEAYSVVVEATSGNATGSSSAVAVTTRGAPAFISSSSAVSRRKVTLTGYLSDLGAGNSATVTLYVGETDDESAFVPAENVTRTAAGTFSISHTFDTFEKTYYWQFRAVATTAGGRTYETRTAVASCKTLDTTTYTWQAVGGEWNGDWSDSAHWANNQKGDCLGFPQSTAATVDFKNCTANNPVVVNVDGNYAVGTFKCYGSAASDITFAGSGANTSGITTSSGYTKSSIASDSTLEFRDMALTLKGEWEFLRETAKTNVTIRFSGVVGGTEKYFALSAGYCRAEFLNGTDFTGGTKFNIGGTNTVVIVDDSTIWANGSTYGFIFNADCNNWGGLKFYFRGKAPRMLTSTMFYPYKHHSDINHSFIFEVPVGGYSEAPIQLTHASTKMFSKGTDANATADYHVVISADSPALKRSLKKLTNIPLIYAHAGFDLTSTRTMDFEAVPEHEGESCGSIFYATEGGAALDAFDTTARKVFANLQGHGKPPTMFVIY